jgi:hypothetical protein
MSREGAGNLIAAVAKAICRDKLNANDLEDELLVHKGCFILNGMGIAPKYKFDQYIRGPYSSELAADYCELLKGKRITYGTDVHPGCIRELSVLIGKGTPFLEAYAALGLATLYNPGMDRGKLIEFVIGMKPRLKESIIEASEYRFRDLSADLL